MSSNFDFFAGPPAAPTAAAPPAASAWAPAASAWAPVTSVDQRFGSPVGEWQPTLSPPVGQFAPQPRSSRRALAVVAVVALVAAAGGAFYLSKRPHPVPLPATLAGLPKLSLPKDEAHELNSDTSSLKKDGVHDVSIGAYGALADGQPGLIAIAGRTSSTIPDFSQLAGAMGQVGQDNGVTVTPQTLTSGASTFLCETIASQGQSIAFCVWEGTHALLMAFGDGVSAQDTADALEIARLDASLH